MRQFANESPIKIEYAKSAITLAANEALLICRVPLVIQIWNAFLMEKSNMGFSRRV